jgi:uncharacterized metal-binding protein YceD (DUF177 family)
MTPEFSRVLRFDILGPSPQPHRVDASMEECAALAKRFGLVRIKSLAADVIVTRQDDIVAISGTVKGHVTQQCVATGEPIPAPLNVPFQIRMTPQGAETDADEIEIDADDCDVMYHDGQSVDIGEVVAQTMLLSLDPWPRHPDADAKLKAAGIGDEAAIGPFAALRALKDKRVD